MTKRHGGFTLIELVVVIVIIAILTTIAVVSYSGIQRRAAATQMLTAASEWKKALEIYKAKNGDLPITASVICLGDTYPAADGFPANSCQIQANGTSLYDVDSAFNTTIDSYIDTMPKTASTTVQFADKYTGSVRGLLFSHPVGAVEAVIYYYLKGDQSCGSFYKSYSPNNSASPGGYTNCSVKIPIDAL